MVLDRINLWKEQDRLSIAASAPHGASVRVKSGPATSGTGITSYEVEVSEGDSRGASGWVSDGFLDFE